MKDILIPITHALSVGDYIVYNPETGRYRILTEAVRHVAVAEVEPKAETRADATDEVGLFTKGVRGTSYRCNQILTLINGTTEEFTAAQIGRALVQNIQNLTVHAWSKFSATMHHDLGVLEGVGCVERIQRPGQQIRFKFIKMPEIPL